MFAEDISEDFSDLTFTLDFVVFLDIFENLRGRLLSSEKFSEVFTLWVFTLKPFPVSGRISRGRPEVIRADVLSQNFLAGPRNLGASENKHLGADIHDPNVRTSMMGG